jgi:hypothetical protein
MGLDTGKGDWAPQHVHWPQGKGAQRGPQQPTAARGEASVVRFAMADGGTCASRAWGPRVQARPRVWRRPRSERSLGSALSPGWRGSLKPQHAPRGLLPANPRRYHLQAFANRIRAFCPAL